jgi:predicted small secreted protein
VKKLAVAILVLVYCLALAGCGGGEKGAPVQNTGNVVEIGEKLFIQQCTDLYMNPEDYEEKLVRIEGICDVWEENGETCYAVYRRTPGCCGDDGVMGFSFSYSGDEQLAMGDWISVTAEVISGTDEYGYATVELNAGEVTVSQERGMEFVTT